MGGDTAQGTELFWKVRATVSMDSKTDIGVSLSTPVARQQFGDVLRLLGEDDPLEFTGLPNDFPSQASGLGEAGDSIEEVRFTWNEGCLETQPATQGTVDTLRGFAGSLNGRQMRFSTQSPCCPADGQQGDEMMGEQATH